MSETIFGMSGCFPVSQGQEMKNLTVSRGRKGESVIFERHLAISETVMKSVNLRYITVGRLDDDMIVPPSDGPMFILINWE